jgi:hypothetical protein
MGVTAAWVFMGVFIFLIERPRKIEETRMGEALQKYWSISISHQAAQINLIKEQNDVMREIERAVNEKSDTCEDEW